MSETELLKKRIRQLRAAQSDGRCVLYLMSRDQRVADNHALLAAQKHALAKQLPLAVVFCLYEKSGNRAREHYEYMVEGLQHVESSLRARNIPFMLVIGNPRERLRGVIHHTQPDAVYVDFNPLRGPQTFLKTLSSEITCSLYEVDTHNIVPIWEVTDKSEFGAYTIRPKIHRRLGEFLHEPPQLETHPIAWPGVVQPMSALEGRIQSVIKAQSSNGTTCGFVSGEKAAHAKLDEFITDKLATYAVDRNDPSKGSQSDLSPYLHFGQLSALRVALRLQEVAHIQNDDLHFMSSPKMPQPEAAQSTVMHGINALIEEMVVRKELADNYCYFNENYDTLAGAPLWARQTLDAHRTDPREHLYSLEQLEHAKTHDEAWNASQRQLTQTGKMHGYMRMYWAKKVLEWTESPEHAIEYLIRLNDFYSIDGGDPNGYVGILWSVGGVHDRPWQDRKIFGKVRYMNYAGLKRKFDIASYEHQWQ